ncbi:MarR family winged helix-turn-helix transcriptional regulator [Plastoroseomonas hellenica]|uniref:MarR family winged helix-turn-helix transcriptional regulator n=1 Tax=Plastoroseomonas hellenica TaxID=2687306 RepID=UPI001BAD0FEF|nr:MarR family transcriptional regulator [Plastoroseomonas hellenica]MBR0646690.1 MarR family transcriptional regulator [Plastoroseomonas hellenica]
MTKRAQNADADIGLNDMLCFAVYSANHAFNRVYRPLLNELGLTYPQYLVMVLLWEADGQRVGDLGARLSLESNTLTPLLKRLEALGHIGRVRDAADERQVRVTLTPQGAALRDKARDIPRCILEASGLTLDDLVRLKTEIATVRDALERHASAQ